MTSEQTVLGYSGNHPLLSSLQLWRTRESKVLVFCLTSQSTIFQSCCDGATASWVFTNTLGSLKCLAQGHYTAVVGFEQWTSRSGVRRPSLSHRGSPEIRVITHDSRLREQWFTYNYMNTTTYPSKYLPVLDKTSHMYFHGISRALQNTKTRN